MAYNIILKNWYQEVGYQKEVLDNKKFDTLKEAVDYLKDKMDYIDQWYPVEKITINGIKDKLNGK
jgi:hypothetical protein